ALGPLLDRRSLALQPGDDALGEQPSQLVRVEQQLMVLPGHPLWPPVRDVRRHHLEPNALRAQVAERQGSAVVLAGEVVQQVREPRRERGPEPVQAASTASATPGTSPASVSGKPLAADQPIRSQRDEPLRPSPAVKSRKYARVPGCGWKSPSRFSPVPIQAGSSASLPKPSRSRPCSAAAAAAAAIAPADVPPTSTKRNVRASSQIAWG